MIYVPGFSDTVSVVEVDKSHLIYKRSVLELHFGKDVELERRRRDILQCELDMYSHLHGSPYVLPIIGLVERVRHFVVYDDPYDKDASVTDEFLIPFAGMFCQWCPGFRTEWTMEEKEWGVESGNAVYTLYNMAMAMQELFLSGITYAIHCEEAVPKPFIQLIDWCLEDAFGSVAEMMAKTASMLKPTRGRAKNMSVFTLAEARLLRFKSLAKSEDEWRFGRTYNSNLERYWPMLPRYFEVLHLQFVSHFSPRLHLGTFVANAPCGSKVCLFRYAEKPQPCGVMVVNDSIINGYTRCEAQIQPNQVIEVTPGILYPGHCHIRSDEYERHTVFLHYLGVGGKWKEVFLFPPADGIDKKTYSDNSIVPQPPFILRESFENMSSTVQPLPPKIQWQRKDPDSPPSRRGPRSILISDRIRFHSKDTIQNRLKNPFYCQRHAAEVAYSSPEHPFWVQNENRFR
ncbi:uncharacterized protein BT62DRAFT_1077825 [Guyanagaster necrorhizus]|uniref:Uncharacterized protein n=1 Tax=Guyanagaster necrorhizus TaxID=856835 RepID=A0A9P7VPI5_9AGAR|nr:uncharacterized protein BT62DRAFT_1077825 [Guyanagaster necrorhizus MCA 3950]KAG7444504.1 hypothetical protein BT62DRAFT_1077825 [Guyanagaster necrorhizus MCA 3950]